MSQQPQAPTPPAPLPQGMRTAISILLFLQIVVVVITVLARGGNSLMASDLERQLRRAVPGARQYARLLHNDLGYDYHFTQGGPEDDDVVIEVELKLPDGSTRAERFPDPSVRPPLRFLRQKMLAYAAGIADGDPEAESRVPQAIAQRLVDETQAIGGRIAVRRHAAIAREDAASTDPKRNDPNGENYWSTIYEGQILIDDEGVVTLLKKASALDAAPAARPNSPDAAQETAP